MNTLANVLYAYIPKNDDELELKVGDKIEVIGVEEEGWWKGRLKGKIGVFPSNFVQVVETTSSSTGPQSITNLPATVTANHTNNKLSLFGKTSKNSLSTNSLNSNNSNSNNNISSGNNNNNNNNNNNLIMNNTQHQENPGLACNDEASITSSERRPKPVRGLGFGDNFPVGMKPKSTPNDYTNERLTTTSLVATLQKQIPKKPPPPAPITLDSSSNGISTTATTNNISTLSSSTDQAPALPPKPANQFSPHLQHSRPLPPAQQLPPPPLPHQHQHQATAATAHQQVREQAEVIYAYEPTNDDELELKAGDIIDIIDKNIEDPGWWRGELHGKIGVFPDNFVKLIEVPDTVISGQDWHQRAAAATAVATPPTQPMTPNFNQISENRDKIKSVFAATPKGFSKELENNLEKNNSPASFLSLKRNKLAQQQSASSTPGTTIGEQQSNLNESMNGSKRDDVIGSMETNTSKLNHITANRAKGPSRRPPSNVLNKRNQLDLGRKESNGRDDVTLGSLPINPTSSNSHSSTIHDSLSSLPTGQHTTNPAPSTTTTTTATTTTAATPTTNNTGPIFGSNQQVKSTDPTSLFTPIKSSLSMDNVLDNNQLPMTPKTSQRLTQVTALDKNKSVATPPWMLELKKAHAERKRDTPSSVSASNPHEDEALDAAASMVNNNNNNNTNTSNNNNNSSTVTSSATVVDPLSSTTDRKPSSQLTRATFNSTSTPTTTGAVKSLSSRYSGDFNSNLTGGEPQQRIGLTGNLPQDSNTSEISSTPVINRLSSVLNKNSPPSKAEFTTPSYGLNSNSTINENNTNNVPSSIADKFLSNRLQNNMGVTLQPINDNVIQHSVNSTSATPTNKSQKSITTTMTEQQDKTPIVNQAQALTNIQYDNLLKQISKDVTSEISVLRDEVKRLREDVQEINELKNILEVMKLELKTCQSATENQKRYIKELVNNLSDERKKIAAMQVEIDRTLK